MELCLYCGLCYDEKFDKCPFCLTKKGKKGNEKKDFPKRDKRMSERVKKNKIKR